MEKLIDKGQREINTQDCAVYYIVQVNTLMYGNGLSWLYNMATHYTDLKKYYYTVVGTLIKHTVYVFVSVSVLNFICSTDAKPN